MPIPASTPTFARRVINQEVCERLRSWIVEGVLQPGEVIRDHALAERLGVSRTPVREALLRLEAEGLVETSPNRWTRVCPITVETAEEIYPIIESLELLALRLAAGANDPEFVPSLRRANRDLAASIAGKNAKAAAAADHAFHNAIVSRSGNAELISLIEGLKQKHRRVESVYFGRSVAALASVTEHKRMIAAIAQRKPKAAAAGLSGNWRNSLIRLREIAKLRDSTKSEKSKIDQAEESADG